MLERVAIMNKNYYDILQVNKNASPEIIEKAYKVLAKKYHPDLQAEENKKQSEEIFKKINEAYEVLSNPEKKQAYDESLLERERNDSNTAQQQTSGDTSYSTPLSEDELRYRQQQESLRQQKIQQERQYQEQLQREHELAYQQELQQARQKAYHDAYIQDLKNRGYKIKYKKTFKDYLKSFIALLITIFILFVLWQIPFVKNFFVNLYEENEIFRLFIDIILGLFK